MSGSYIAPRASLSPRRADCVQLLLLDDRVCSDIGAAQGLVLRLAQHAGTAQDLALRFAEAAVCPPELGQDRIRTALAQGHLVDVPSLPGLGTVQPPRLPQELAIASTPEQFNLLRSTMPPGHCLVFDSCGKPMGLPQGEVSPLLAQHLEGLHPREDSRYEALQDARSAIAQSIAQAPRAIWADGPVMAEASWLRWLASRDSWLGICLHRSHPLPGPVISDAGACRAGRGQCLVLNPANWLPPLHPAFGKAYGGLLCLLHPGSRLLHLTVASETRADAPDVRAEAARIAMLCAPAQDPRTSLTVRQRSIIRHLDTLARSPEPRLLQELTATWLRDWAARDRWLAIYGLSQETRKLPDFSSLDVARFQADCGEYARLLAAAATIPTPSDSAPGERP